MDIFKKASKDGLRVQTLRGPLSVEQLWGLTLPELDALAVELLAAKKASGKKSFLTTTTVKDATAKLRFDIVLDILETKFRTAEIASKASETKAHNQKIISLIKEKQDDVLKGKSIEELEAELR